MPEQLGEALAREILDGIAATPPDRRYLLGCPGGRSLRSTYQALARLVPADADLRRLVIVMMDEYVVETADGPRRIDPAATAAAPALRRARSRAHQRRGDRGHGILPEHVWGPGPCSIRPRTTGVIEEAGGVDLFLTASGAGDGHLAFVAAGGAPDGRHRGAGSG